MFVGSTITDAEKYIGFNHHPFERLGFIHALVELLKQGTNQGGL